MRIIRFAALPLACILLLFCVLFTGAAQSSDEEEHLFATVELQREPLPQTYSERIVGFDVSQDGEILLLLEHDHILYINSELKPAAYFSFQDLGSDYVFWEDEDFVLLSVRGARKLRYSTDGSAVHAETLDDSSIEYNDLINELFHKKSIVTRDCTYQLKRESGIYGLFSWTLANYRSLVMIKPDGSEQVIYQGKSIAGKFWSYVLFLHCIGGICVFRLVLRKKKSGKSGVNQIQSGDSSPDEG